MKTVIVKGTKKEVEGLRAPSREAEGRRAAAWHQCCGSGSTRNAMRSSDEKEIPFTHIMVLLDE